MSWIYLTLLSAVFLGIYDLAKKAAVRENAVPVVLLLNVLTAAALYLPILLASQYVADWMPEELLVKPMRWNEHGLVLCKSMLVGASWTCAFFGLKHLPLSIAAPIRATSPLWTILIAVSLLAERPSKWQWCGIVIVLAGFGMLTQVGRREGIRFTRNRWALLMCAATILGALSALYDKVLLQRYGLEPATMQAWFSVYLCPVMLPLALRWYVLERKTQPFQFRWTIPAIACCLLLADFVYFSAMSDTQALISVVSPIRRTSAVIPFLFGIWQLKEPNWKAKSLCLGFMLIGVVLLGW